MRSFVSITLALASACLLQLGDASAAIELRDEGVVQDYVWNLDCVGSGVACTGSSSNGTITISGGAGDIEGVTAGAGLTGGGTTGTVTLDVGAGTYIDINADDIAVDATEMLDVTFAAGANASQTWTWDVSGTDPQATFGSDALTLNAEDITIQGAAPNICQDPDSGSAWCWHVDPGGLNSWLAQGSTHHLMLWAGGGTGFPQLLNCDTLDTDGSGRLSCGTDATGAGGGDPVLIDGTGVTDGSGVDLIGGTNGIDIAFSAAASPDTATFNFDPTEVENVTWGGGTLTSWTFDTTGANNPTMEFGLGDIRLVADSSTLQVEGTGGGGNKITLTADLLNFAGAGTYVSGSFTSNVDITLAGTGPDLRWAVTGDDTFHAGAEAGGLWFLSNVTDSVHYLNIYGDHHITLGATGNVPYVKVMTDGTGDGEVQLPASSIGNSEVVGGLSKCGAVENLAAADDNMPLGSMPVAVTVTAVWCHCYGTCSTPATIALEDDAGNAMTGTATCDTGGGVATPATITAGGALVAYEGLRFDTTNAVSPETDEYSLCFGF